MNIYYNGNNDDQTKSVETYCQGIKALQNVGFELFDFTIENFDDNPSEEITKARNKITKNLGWFHVSANFGSSSYCIALTVAFDLKEQAESFLEKVEKELGLTII